MSTTYPQFPATSFPDEVQELITYTDLSGTDLVNYNIYKQQIERGDFAGAKTTLALIENDGQYHKAISAGEINKLVDTVNALQAYMSNEGWEQMVSQTQAKWMEIINQFSLIGQYNNTHRYAKWNMVTYASPTAGTDGTTYLYISLVDNNIGNNPYIDYEQSDGYWYRLTIRGAQGQSGANGTFKGTWSASTNYITNDIATYNGVWWAAKRNNVNVIPVEGNDWTLFLEPKLRQYPVQTTQPTGQEVGDLWFEVI